MKFYCRKSFSFSFVPVPVFVGFNKKGYPRVYNLVNFKYDFGYSLYGFTENWKNFDI